MIEHPDTAVRHIFPDRGRVVCPVNTVMGPGQTHPEHTERPAGMTLLVYDFIVSRGGRRQHPSGCDRIGFDQTIIVEKLQFMLLCRNIDPDCHSSNATFRYIN
jgi:hypothetical protein